MRPSFCVRQAVPQMALSHKQLLYKEPSPTTGCHKGPFHAKEKGPVAQRQRVLSHKGLMSLCATLSLASACPTCSIAGHQAAALRAIRLQHCRLSGCSIAGLSGCSIAGYQAAALRVIRLQHCGPSGCSIAGLSGCSIAGHQAAALRVIRLCALFWPWLWLVTAPYWPCLALLRPCL